MICEVCVVLFAAASVNALAKQQYLDPTRTGYATYRELQRQNDPNYDKYIEEHFIGKDGSDPFGFRFRDSNERSYDPSLLKPRKVEISTNRDKRKHDNASAHHLTPRRNDNLAKRQYLDSTKTGLASSRQLQRQNDSNYDSIEEHFIGKDGSDPLGFRFRNSNERSYDPGILQPREVEISTNWGESRWDNTSATIDELDHLDDIRAKNKKKFMTWVLLLGLPIIFSICFIIAKNRDRKYHYNIMQNEEDIQFDEMQKPDMFGKMFAGNLKRQDKTYDSLYDELKDKCDPKQLVKSGKHDLVPIATELFKSIIQNKDNQCALDDLRRQASAALGVKFDGTKLYNYLMEYLDPNLYQEKHLLKKYDFVMKYYPLVEASKDDYVALEKIQTDVKDFIENEIREKKAQEPARQAQEARHAQEEARVQKETKTERIIIILLGLALFTVILLTLIDV